MWKHKNFINLQLCAGPRPFVIYVNGEQVEIQRLSDSMVPGEETWSYNASINTDKYTISGNTVVWSDGTILQYNGVDVLPTDNIQVYIEGQYTTRSATPTLTFKHFYDAGTIGSGTVKFRHYSQQEPSSGETWVLNETIPITSQGSGGYNANFVSNGTTYTYINFDGKPNGIRYSNSTDEILAYSWVDNAWTNQVYRTLTFATPPTGDLLTWLQANGTKQGGGGAVTEHHLSWENSAISGTSVYVNGVGVQNGYLLKNGDVITFQPAYELTVVNNVTYAYSDGEEALTFTITNEDIVIKQGGTLPAKTAWYSFTITYQQ